MKKLPFILGFVLSALLVSRPIGAQVGPKDASVNLGPVLKGQTLAADRGFRITFPKTEGWSTATFFFDVTDADNSVTALTMKCYAMYDEVVPAFTGITRVNCGTDTLILTVNGVDVNFVEATDWVRGATDATATAALAAAFPSKTAGAVVTTTSSNAVYLKPGGASLYSLWLYSSDATCAVAYNGDLRSALQSGSPAAGTFTSYDSTWSAGNAANQPLNPTGAGGLHKKWPWRVDITNLRALSCSVSPTGGAAADLITVNARLSVR